MYINLYSESIIDIVTYWLVINLINYINYINYWLSVNIYPATQLSLCVVTRGHARSCEVMRGHTGSDFVDILLKYVYNQITRWFSCNQTSSTSTTPDNYAIYCYHIPYNPTTYVITTHTISAYDNTHYNHSAYIFPRRTCQRSSSHKCLHDKKSLWTRLGFHYH